jgi:spermidine synthase
MYDNRHTFSRSRFLVLLLCFFLSGCAGLIYQVAWTKALGLVFGHTVYAIATVLAAFMGGLAAGSAFLGRWGERHSRPVALYGWIELLIAITGAVSLLGINIVRSLYLATYHIASGSTPLLVALRFLASIIVLFVPTFLMGGTLPILTRGLSRTSAELGARLSRL